MNNLVAFLPWEETDRKETPCSAENCRTVATKLAAENPGKAVHVIREGDIDVDSSERIVVWDTYCKPTQE